MAPANDYHPTPKAAAKKRSELDRLLDPALFKAVADPTRSKIFACIVKVGRACTVTEVAAASHVDFSVVARHLAALARAGLLDVRRSGRMVWYRPLCAELCERLRRLISAIEAWCPNPTAGAADGAGCCAAPVPASARQPPKEVRHGRQDD